MTITQQTVHAYYESWKSGTFDRAKFDGAVAPNVPGGPLAPLTITRSFACEYTSVLVRPGAYQGK